MTLFINNLWAKSGNFIDTTP